MLASFPASMVNQISADLGIPNRFRLNSSRSSEVAAARERIAELERKIGQQQVDLDFFRQALRRVGGTRRRNAEPGAPPSTKSSKR